MTTIRYILVSAISLAMFLGYDYLAHAFPTLLVQSTDETVQDGAEVTAHFQIAPWDNPTVTY
ncbi:MAG: hypothetical protein ACREIG_00335, partial [Nitrospiraceae bacterium]